MTRTNYIDDLKTAIQKKREGKESIKTEKKRLQDEIENLEIKFSTDLEFEEYQECKAKLEYTKDKLNKFINTVVETPEELIREIDKNVLLISKDIQNEYDEKSKEVYEEFKASLKKVIEVIDERNTQINELNSITSGEIGINERSLRIDLLKEFRSEQISIFSSDRQGIAVKQKYGTYSDDFNQVYIR